MRLSSPEKIVTLFVTLHCDPRSAHRLFNAGMKRTSLQTKPYMLNEKQGFKSLGARVSILAGTEQTGSTFNLFDARFPAGYETPLHIHYAEDVAIQLLEGTLDIFWGDEKKEARAGSFFFQPRGTPHGFRVTGTGAARLFYMTIPAGFDGFVIEHSQPRKGSELMVSAAHYKIEVLGSLPVEDIGIQF
jgi:quercetin dioxygenase-like cupin family protein